MRQDYRIVRINKNPVNPVILSKRVRPQAANLESVFTVNPVGHERIFCIYIKNPAGSGTLNAAVGKALGPADTFVIKGQKRGVKLEIRKTLKM